MRLSLYVEKPGDRGIKHNDKTAISNRLIKFCQSSAQPVVGFSPRRGRWRRSAGWAAAGRAGAPAVVRRCRRGGYSSCSGVACSIRRATEPTSSAPGRHRDNAGRHCRRLRAPAVAVPLSPAAPSAATYSRSTCGDAGSAGYRGSEAIGFGRMRRPVHKKKKQKFTILNTKDEKQ